MIYIFAKYVIFYSIVHFCGLMPSQNKLFHYQFYFWSMVDLFYKKFKALQIFKPPFYMKNDKIRLQITMKANVIFSVS